MTSGSDLNEQTLADMILKIKQHTGGKPVRLKPPKQIIVPPGVVQQVAEERGCSLKEAQQYLRDVAERMLKGERGK